MASLPRWTWVWVSSRHWWCTGKPSMLQSTGSQRVRNDWATELKKQPAFSPKPPTSCTTLGPQKRAPETATVRGSESPQEATLDTAPARQFRFGFCSPSSSSAAMAPTPPPAHRVSVVCSSPAPLPPQCLSALSQTPSHSRQPVWLLILCSFLLSDV